MSLEALTVLLRRFETLFRSTGGARQADGLSALTKAVEKTGSRTLDEFVVAASARLSVPDATSSDSATIAHRLTALRTDRTAFEAILKEMTERSFPKEKVIAIAAQYTGMRKTNWATKPSALKAIKDHFEQRAYLSEKADAAISSSSR